MLSNVLISQVNNVLEAALPLIEVMVLLDPTGVNSNIIVKIRVKGMSTWADCEPASEDNVYVPR